MVTIIPVASIQPDIEEYLKLSGEVLKHSLARDADKNGYSIHDTRFYWSTLEKNFCSPLRHLFYSFLIVGFDNFFFEILRKGSDGLTFDLLETKEQKIFLALASGTLEQWKEFIVNCHRSELNQIRYLTTALIGFFEHEGLYIFKEYEKHLYPDQTLQLELK